MNKQNDLLVIGAGLAGLMTAYQAAGRGQKVRVIAKGWGATHWHSGCIDVLGYYPVDATEPVVDLQTAVSQLIADNPQHPYALVGLNGLQAALDSDASLVPKLATRCTVRCDKTGCCPRPPAPSGPPAWPRKR
jgi:anaerobic glycerol-3-phosphate dehydrogenase